MQIVTFLRVLLLAALLLPAAASAGIAIDPERLNGEDFTFLDVNENLDNQLVFDVDGRVIGFEGQVIENVGLDLITITYEAGYPNQTSASENDADASQDTQVLVTLSVTFFDEGTLDYSGQAAPIDCSAAAKIHDNGGPPDSPDVSQASLSCDLGRDLGDLDPPPGNAVLTVLEQAFGGRKDVKLDAGKGKLSIKSKGEAFEEPI